MWINISEVATTRDNNAAVASLLLCPFLVYHGCARLVHTEASAACTFSNHTHLGTADQDCNKHVAETHTNTCVTGRQILQSVVVANRHTIVFWSTGRLGQNARSGQFEGAVGQEAQKADEGELRSPSTGPPGSPAFASPAASGFASLQKLKTSGWY